MTKLEERKLESEYLEILVSNLVASLSILQKAGSTVE